jgi:hypothetical protein
MWDIGPSTKSKAANVYLHCRIVETAILVVGVRGSMETCSARTSYHRTDCTSGRMALLCDGPARLGTEASSPAPRNTQCRRSAGENAMVAHAAIQMCERLTELTLHHWCPCARCCGAVLRFPTSQFLCVVLPTFLNIRHHWLFSLFDYSSSYNYFVIDKPIS